MRVFDKPKLTKELAESIDLKLGFGLYVTEENYEKYAECVFDLDGEEGYEKDSGNTKEYVVLIDKSIKV